MRTLTRLASDKQALPQRLPDIFQTLARAGIHFWAATVHLIAGVPGSMKSWFAAYLVARMQVPTLYFSADMDAGRTLKRFVTMRTGLTGEQVQAKLEEDEHAFDDVLADFNHIRWVFEPNPTYKDLVLELMAFAEAYGEWPAVTVVDTLMKVVGENEDEWASMRETTKAFDTITAATNTGLIALHHMKEEKVDPSVPAPRNALKGRVSEVAEVILSVAYDRAGGLHINPSKNRDDEDDPSGRRYVTVYVDPTHGQFYDSKWHFENGMSA